MDARATKTADAAQAAPPAIAATNGPEDEITDWLSIDWQQVEDDVRRLRQRIFTATQAGDLAKARNLQKLMLRSRSNALLSVRRVTEGVRDQPGLAAWLRLLALDGDLAPAEPKALRFRMLHVPARLTRSGRRRILQLPRHWPWADHIVEAFRRIMIIPAPT